MDKIVELKTDVQMIKNKINECVDKNIFIPFDIEMIIMSELPEIYDQYPMLIKNTIKVQLINYKINKLREQGITDKETIINAFKNDSNYEEIFNNSIYLINSIVSGQFLDSFLDKMISNLESVIKGDKSLASVEMNLGMELKNKFLDPHLDKLNSKN